MPGTCEAGLVFITATGATVVSFTTSGAAVSVTEGIDF